MSRVRNGLLSVISKGLNLVVVLGAALILKWAVGSRWYHNSDISWQSLPKVFFSVWLTYSTFPEDWGLQDKWRRYLIPKACESSCVTFVRNEGSLSLWRWWGNLTLGIISFRSNLATSIAFSVLMGTASIHPVKASIKTSKYVKPWKEGIWVKSNCLSSPGWVPHPWTGLARRGGLRVPPGLWVSQRAQARVILTVVTRSPFPVKHWKTIIDLSSPPDGENHVALY